MNFLLSQDELFAILAYDINYLFINRLNKIKIGKEIIANKIADKKQIKKNRKQRLFQCLKVHDQFRQFLLAVFLKSGKVSLSGSYVAMAYGFAYHFHTCAHPDCICRKAVSCPIA